METDKRVGSVKELPIEMKKILQNTDFPIKKKDIIEQGRKSEATPDIMQEFGMLPDREYQNAEDVAKEIHRIYIGVPA
jgi:hypothetical protein